MRVTGLGEGLPAGLARWRAPRAVHDPGKILTDLVVTLALGGDCLADVAVLRAQPELSGPVASDPVISRLVSAAGGGCAAGAAGIRKARAAARERAWALAGERAPGADGSLIPVDIDATIVHRALREGKGRSHLEEDFGFHPLAAFADHGAGAGGEPLGILLRAGNAGSNTVAEHIAVTKLALAELPRRARRRVLIRTDSGGGTHDFLTWLASPSRRLHYSVGMTITEDMHEAILTLPERVWEPAYDADGEVRPGAWAAELTGLLDLAGWLGRMRVIARNERPPPARSCGSPTLVGTGSPASPPTPRVGSSLTWNYVIAAAPGARTASVSPRTPGCVTSPLHGFGQNQIWCELVAMASELTAWMQMLALDGTARAWEPKRLRLRLFSAAGRLVRGGRRNGCASPPPGPGPASSPPRSPGCRRTPPADQPAAAPTTRKDNPRARGTPPTRRDSRETRHGQTLKQQPAAASARPIKIAKHRGLTCAVADPVL